MCFGPDSKMSVRMAQNIFMPKKLRNLAIRVFKNYRRHERKVRQSLFASVKINSTIAKLTVWHNWLNRMRLA